MKIINHRIRISSFQIIIGSFLAIILTGTVLLMLPFSSRQGTMAPFSDALFTATSAVCVTGLVVRISLVCRRYLRMCSLWSFMSCHV